MYTKWTMEESFDCHYRTVAVAQSVMNCHFKAFAKSNYPRGHIVLNFWKMKCFVHYCEQSPVIPLFWLVVIQNKIFLMRPVFFGILWMKSNIDDLIWVTALLIIHIWRHLLSFLLKLQSKTASVVAHTNYTSYH